MAGEDSNAPDGRTAVWVKMLVDREADCAQLILAPEEDSDDPVNACNFDCPDLAGDVTIDHNPAGQILGIELRGLRGLLRR